MVSKKKASKKTNRKSTAKNKNNTSIAHQSRRRRFFSFAGFWLLRIALLMAVPLLAYTVYLDVNIRKKFEGQKWALPAHVYTRPLEIYLGQKFDTALVQAELDELGYVERANLNRVGSFQFSSNKLSIFQREFRFMDGLRPQQIIHIALRDGRIQKIEIEQKDGASKVTEIVRLEPRLFGSVSPLSHEDRSLLKLEDVPQALIDALIANEDRKFYDHFGVNPMGIARAMVRNIRAGRFVQGGSTLTQQLVKNYYLSSERSLRRKFNELIMSVLLEIHYSKEEILQAYFNEMFLGQAGNRAIHGFALGSRYFFGRPLQELELEQMALLVAINNGPSLYNPLRRPELSLKRRNLVLKTMFEQEHIEQAEYELAIDKPLGLSANAASAAILSYPSFLGFVREKLKADYKQEDLLSDGLQIHTTLNPRIQKSLEETVRKELKAIETRKRIMPGSLQVGAVVVRTDNGEVAAMLGDRNPSFSGFNRALNARRPVGSLLKPFVYLTALEHPESYSLASLIDDIPITVSQKGSPDWSPQNYDRMAHGPVMMIDALARSYNLATVNLGIELGVDKVAQTIKKVGYDNAVRELPSLLLGSVDMSVLDVSQLYLSLASGGFKMPIQSIRSVLSNQNEPLTHYSLDIQQVIEPDFSTLINYALQDVVRNGTARNVLTGFKYDYGLAGKTGTTDDNKDSWFAGFSGNYLTVVWVGRDDNKPTALTGASGAARVWSKVMQKMPLQRLELNYGEKVIKQEIYYSQDPLEQDCTLSRTLPMLISSFGQENIPCPDRIQYDDGEDDEFRHYEPLSDPKSDNSELPPGSKKRKKSWWKRVFG